MEQDRKIVIGHVKKNESISDQIFEMTIESEIESCSPGQFVNVYLDDKSMLLPRPISICEHSGNTLTIVYRISGKGTKCLSEYKAGSSVKISTPLGNGYQLEKNIAGKRVALVAGGIGIPPMVELAKVLKEKRAEVNVFFGFASNPFLLDKIAGSSDFLSIATEDGSSGFTGNIVDLVSQAASFDEYYACGPKGMLRALSTYVERVDRNVQVSLEERMGCGYGACVGCACKIREGERVLYKSVCKHGPVFCGKDVVWDE